MRRPSRRNARGLHSAPAPGSWNPSQLAGYAFDYDSESYASGTLLDLSGNGRDLSQANEVLRPAQVSRNGQLALQFSGGQWLQGAFGATLAQPMTIYSVAEVGSNVLYDGVDSSNRIGLHHRATNTELRPFAPTQVVMGTWSSGVQQARAVVHDGASSAAYVDNFVIPSGTGDPGAHSLTGFTLGAAYDGAQAFNGHIWRVTGYLGAHDAPTRKLMGDYLAARYSIPIVT